MLIMICVVGRRVQTVDNETNEKPPYDVYILSNISPRSVTVGILSPSKFLLLR